MKFLQVPISSAFEGILAHNIFDEKGRRVLQKGLILSAQDLSQLRGLGIREVYIARKEPGDLLENDAAKRIAAVVTGPGVIAKGAVAGRSNLKASHCGILRVNIAAIHRINEVDDGMTIATLTHHSYLREGQLLATIKIIPFAVPEKAVRVAENFASTQRPVLKVDKLRVEKISLIVSSHQDDHARILKNFLPALASRLDLFGLKISNSAFAQHQPEDLAQAIQQQIRKGCQMILVISMSAIIDRQDVIPTAVAMAGGVVEHFGVPVDPGNLLMVGYLKNVAIVGVPGCARSRKVNAFDLVLPRLLAGDRLSRQDLTRLGHGGLLEEIRERTLLREASEAG